MDHELWTNSNIHNHFCQPPIGGFLNLEFVVRDRLHFVSEKMPGRIEWFAPSNSSQSIVANLNLELTEHYMVLIASHEEVAKPVEQQEFAIGAREFDGYSCLRLNAGNILKHSREQALGSFREQGVQVSSTNPEPEVGGVFKQFVHTVDDTPSAHVVE